MLDRKLGTSSLRVSVLGLGGNTFGPPRISREATIDIIHAALDDGVTFIDTAHGYGQGESESYIGQALAGKRDRAVVATKFNFRELDGNPVDRIRKHCEESLRKLRTDYIDLLQIHQPTDLISTDGLLSTLAGLVSEGKIRAYGASNYSGWRLAESALAASSLGVPPFASVQNQYSLLYRRAEQEHMQACARYDISFIPFHPLAGGLLTGKYRRNEPPPPGTRGAAGSPIIKRMSTGPNWDVISRLASWAHDNGHTVGELAIAWLVAQPCVGTVITGVSNVGQLRQNIRGADWVLTEDQMAELDRLSDTGENAPTENYAAQVGRSGQ